jgi:hypothetical protein
MKTRLLQVLILALPLAGLGLVWAETHHRTQQGVIWEVPVAGYDPRDLLRGHYITYRYEWPGLDDEVRLGWNAHLCIEGKPPVIAKTVFPANFGRFGDATCDQQQHLLRAREDAHEGVRGLESGILYVPQEQAAELEKQLLDPKLQGFVRIRVRDDGLITPIDITFRPRPAQTPAAE